MINSYPSIYAIGHKAIADIFASPVLVEEKIDGSQFSFMVNNASFELECRSKGKQIIVDAVEPLFVKAVESIKSIQKLLTPGYVYRCEYLSKPKHNTLAYDRVPERNLILFDVQTGIEEYMSHEHKLVEAKYIGLECVPVMYEGMVDSFEAFAEFLERTSILGGSKIEGVVVKNYSIFTQEKKVSMGKYVSEKFKEIHGGEWRKNNPTGTDIVTLLIQKYRTPARWQKSVQHLRDDGMLEESPRDIGKLIVEVTEDTKKECEDEIKDILFTHFWSKIRRGITSGLPEWYKEELAKTAFDGGKK